MNAIQLSNGNISKNWYITDIHDASWKNKLYSIEQIQIENEPA